MLAQNARHVVCWMVHDYISFVGSLAGLGNKCANVDVVSLDVNSDQCRHFHGVHDMCQCYKLDHQQLKRRSQLWNLQIVCKPRVLVRILCDVFSLCYTLQRDYQQSNTLLLKGTEIFNFYSYQILLLISSMLLFGNILEIAKWCYRLKIMSESRDRFGNRREVA